MVFSLPVSPFSFRFHYDPADEMALWDWLMGDIASKLTGVTAAVAVADILNKAIFEINLFKRNDSLKLPEQNS